MNARAWLLALCVGAAGAQALPAPPGVSLDQRIGATVPLALAVQDDRGRPARLADYFGARTPVLLVLGYYRCPQLCGLVMHSLLDGLQATKLPATQWRIVGLSIDPQDGTEEARRRREQDLAYARWLADGQTPARLDLLVAAPPDVERLAQSVGFRYAADPDGVAHPATVVVLTPDGRVASYFNGIGLDPAALRAALVQAREGGTGSWSERLALFCSHLDPSLGRHTGAVMAALRSLGLATLVLLAALAWRQARKRAR